MPLSPRRATHRRRACWDDKAMTALRGEKPDYATLLPGIEGIDLRGRSLRFAVLDDSRLFAADLVEAKLAEREASAKRAAGGSDSRLDKPRSWRARTSPPRSWRAHTSSARSWRARTSASRSWRARTLEGARLAGADLARRAAGGRGPLRRAAGGRGPPRRAAGRRGPRLRAAGGRGPRRRAAGGRGPPRRAAGRRGPPLRAAGGRGPPQRTSTRGRLVGSNHPCARRHPRAQLHCRDRCRKGGTLAGHRCDPRSGSARSRDGDA